MSKFHINKHGVPAPCRAKKGNCPLGGEGQHFDTQEEAQVYADKINEKAHDLLPGVNLSSQSELFKRNYDYAFSRADSIEKDMTSQSTEDIGGYVKAIQEVSAMRVGEESLANSIAGEGLKLMSKNKKIEESIARDVDEELGISAGQDELVSLGNDLIEAQEQNDKNHKVGETCPKCGKGTLVKRSGKYGEFVACDNFPECKSTSKFSESKEEKDIKNNIEKVESKVKIAEMRKPLLALNKQKENSEHIENKSKLEELDNLRKLASYIDRNSKDGSKTPVEEYYELRKSNDKKIRSQIGENSTVFTDGGLRPGAVVKVGENVTVDKDGSINNLYIEKEDSGEVKRIKDFSQQGFTLEDGEEVSFTMTTNWNMSSSRNAEHPQSHRVYETKPNGNKYEKENYISIHNYDSSD